MLTFLLLFACGPDATPSSLSTGSPTTSGPAIAAGDHAFAVLDVLEDDCGGGLFDQEIRRFDTALDLTTVLDVEAVPCEVDALGFVCGPGDLELPFYPGSVETLTVSAVVEGGVVEALVEREIDGGCTQVYEAEVRPMLPEVELARVSCMLEDAHAATASMTQTRFDVVNATDEALTIAWLDYDGQRAPAETIEVGETWTAGVTFVGHAYVVMDASGECVGIAAPSAEYGVLTVE